MRATASRVVVAIAAAAAFCQFGVGTATAVPGPAHHIAVPPGIGIGRVIVLRPHRIDLFNGGRYARSFYLDGQHATLNGLTDTIGDPAFLSRPARGTVLVSAAIIQRPHTGLVVGGSGLRTVELRADPVSPAFIRGTRASVTFSGVTVIAMGPLASAGRPFLSYGGHSIIIATSSRFAHLGRPGTRPLAALDVGVGSTLTATNVAFTDNAVGLRAANSAAVRLSIVTASRSSDDGIILRNAGRVSAHNVTVNDNRGDGLVLAGAGTHLFVTGSLTATGNRRSGIAATSGVATTISGAHTRGNGVAGVDVHDAGVTSVLGLASTNEPVAIRIDSAADSTADGVIASGDQVGINVTARSRNVKLHSITVNGANIGVRINAHDVSANLVTVTRSGIGVQISSTARNVQVSGLIVTNPVADGTVSTGAVVAGDGTTLTGSRIDGVGIGLRITGIHTTIKGGSVSATGTAVRLSDIADGTAVSGATVRGGKLGVSVANIGTLALTRDVISGSVAALRTSGGTTTVTASTLTSTGIGVDAHARVTLTHSTISAAVGAHIASGVVARFDTDQIHGAITGIHVVDGGRVSVISSHVTGRVPISGTATVLGLSFIGSLPLHWLGAFGLALLVLALFLVALSRSRERGHVRLVLAPAHVNNRA